MNDNNENKSLNESKSLNEIFKETANSIKTKSDNDNTISPSNFASSVNNLTTFFSNVYVGLDKPDSSKYNYWLPIDTTKEKTPIKMVDSCYLDYTLTGFTSDSSEIEYLDCERFEGFNGTDTSTVTKDYMLRFYNGSYNVTASFFKRPSASYLSDPDTCYFGINYFEAADDAAGYPIDVYSCIKDRIYSNNYSYWYMSSESKLNNNIWFYYSNTDKYLEVSQINIDTLEVQTFTTSIKLNSLSNNYRTSGLKYIGSYGDYEHVLLVELKTTSSNFDLYIIYISGTDTYYKKLHSSTSSHSLNEKSFKLSNDIIITSNYNSSSSSSYIVRLNSNDLSDVSVISVSDVVTQIKNYLTEIYGSCTVNCYKYTDGDLALFSIKLQDRQYNDYVLVNIKYNYETDTLEFSTNGYLDTNSNCFDENGCSLMFSNYLFGYIPKTNSIIFYNNADSCYMIRKNSGDITIGNNTVFYLKCNLDSQQVTNAPKITYNINALVDCSNNIVIPTLHNTSSESFNSYLLKLYNDIDNHDVYSFIAVNSNDEIAAHVYYDNKEYLVSYYDKDQGCWRNSFNYEDIENNNILVSTGRY
jgi:hypothetical protein